MPRSFLARRNYDRHREAEGCKRKALGSGEDAFGPVAKRLVANQARFQAMETRTGVPSFVFAVIKDRVPGADPQWLKSIAQGQPWNMRSTIVPHRARGVQVVGGCGLRRLC